MKDNLIARFKEWWPSNLNSRTTCIKNSWKITYKATMQRRWRTDYNQVGQRMQTQSTASRTRDSRRGHRGATCRRQVMGNLTGNETLLRERELCILQLRREGLATGDQRLMQRHHPGVKGAQSLLQRSARSASRCALLSETLASANFVCQLSLSPW